MPKMDILNLLFGAVTILSFGYALWANRTLYNLQSQRDRAISSIRDIAHRLHQGTPESAPGTAAYSIMRICDSLVPPTFTGRLVGRLRLDYPPWEHPPMNSHGGSIIRDTRTRLGTAWESFKHGERARFYAVFGPYHPLPVLGRYTIAFWICLPEDANPLPEDTHILRLDAYAYVEGKTILSERVVKLSELSVFEYREFRITFDYLRAGQALEYRVELLTDGVKVRVSDIRVEYQAVT